MSQESLTDTIKSRLVALKGTLIKQFNERIDLLLVTDEERVAEAGKWDDDMAESEKTVEN